MQTPVLFVVACVLVAASARPLITSDGEHSWRLSGVVLWLCASPFVRLWAVQGPQQSNDYVRCIVQGQCVCGALGVCAWIWQLLEGSAQTPDKQLLR